MSDLMRRVLDVVKPKGSIWNIAPNGDWSKFFDGLAANLEIPRQFLSELANVRNPDLTTYLEDLENELGVFTNPNLTDTQRRQQLKPILYNRDSNGDHDTLENALISAGFNVQVHENSPAVDPAIFLNEQFQMTAGQLTASAGNQDAFAGRVGGELLVNGDIFSTEKIHTSGAGTFYAGDGTGAGEYSGLIRVKTEYPIPALPEDWPLVFFVGGDATRDGSGALTAIELASVPSEQESAFKRIILKYKPMHSWAALIVNYT
jgi:hypothetical protein